MSNDTKQAHVVEAYTSAYPDPLVLAKGDPVTVGRNDDEWPGFVWCTDTTGKSGWIPENYLERQQNSSLGHLKCDYTAQELTVAVGEIVTIIKQESGWVWGMTESGQVGWMPRIHLEII